MASVDRNWISALQFSQAEQSKVVQIACKTQHVIHTGTFIYAPTVAIEAIPSTFFMLMPSSIALCIWPNEPFKSAVTSSGKVVVFTNDILPSTGIFAHSTFTFSTVSITYSLDITQGLLYTPHSNLETQHHKLESLVRLFIVSFPVRNGIKAGKIIRIANDWMHPWGDLLEQRKPSSWLFWWHSYVWSGYLIRTVTDQ